MAWAARRRSSARRSQAGATQVVLATKCGLVWHTTKGRHFFDQAGKPVHRYLGPESIAHELEQSLKRLRTDYIDLYITHWQDPTTPIAETMGALEDLKKAGKIRAIGASNVVDGRRRGYRRRRRRSMRSRNSTAWCIATSRRSLLPLCARHGVSILSYSSLALGLLTGKIGPERKFEGDDLRIADPRFSIDEPPQGRGFRRRDRAARRGARRDHRGDW